VNCDAAREAISALLDGEAPGPELSELEEHLAGCLACQRWRERAHKLTRSVRLQPARPVPRPPTGLIEAVRNEHRGRPWRAGRLTRTRIALVILAAAQLALSVRVLVLGRGDSAPLHLAHEIGSFDVAVAVGFVVAARRPARAMGMLSLMGVAAVLLVLTAVIDLVGGRTDLLDEAPHLLVVAGWLLLRRLAAVAPPSWERPRSVLALLGSAKVVLAERRVRDLRAAPSSTPLDGVASIGAQTPGFAATDAARIEKAVG